MNDLSDNYYLRKCYLQRDQVPTQTMMKTKMSPALAAIYFNSMTPKLRVVAGLEPLLKGGGTDWYVPPEELLKGRSVLKPIEKKIMSKLNHHGIELIGTSVFHKHRKYLQIEKEKAIAESDMKWRDNLSSSHDTMVADLAAVHRKKNTDNIKYHFKQFTHLYRESLRIIENIFHESAIAAVKKTQENATISMQNKYSVYLNHQAKLIYDVYEKKLIDEKSRLKANFIKKLEKSKKGFDKKIHDNNVDKHKALSELKQYFVFQNLACQIYVALKEREECLIEMTELQRKHKKETTILAQSLATKDLEIFLETHKQRKHQQFSDMWKVKLCHVVKMFQTFVSYCLNMLPDHAEFFINLEKLMLLQVNDALEDPTAESIITTKEEEEEGFVTPVPQVVPFHIFCDRGYKAQVDQDLCPKHGGTPSTTQMPAIIINKRFLYANCDNFELLINKIKDYIHGNRGDDADLNDDIVYENLVPVTYTPSQQLKEIQLESSLLAVLKEEIIQLNSNIPDDIDLCENCQTPFCFCTELPRATATSENKPNTPQESKSSEKRSVTQNIPLNRIGIQDHEREPKWESYFSYVEPKACACTKTAKKRLEHNFPVYMRQMNYQPSTLPDYEMCSDGILKSLVKGARKRYSSDREIVPVEAHVVLKKDMSTQCSDAVYEKLCTCLSDLEVQYFFNSNPCLDPNPAHVDSTRDIGCHLVGSDMSPSFLTRRASSFASNRARSLRNLLGGQPELQIIFTRND
ncbi:hypothetical protein B5X24_HaOG208553 [Helicoverpa armigera]|nr:hypothetical protein B5X24_HaOG208553 [Helicoverpa armigera]